MNTKELKEAVQELDEYFGLDPKVDLTQADDVIERILILECVPLLRVTDNARYRAMESHVKVAEITTFQELKEFVKKHRWDGFSEVFGRLNTYRSIDVLRKDILTVMSEAETSLKKFPNDLVLPFSPTTADVIRELGKKYHDDIYIKGDTRLNPKEIAVMTSFNIISNVPVAQASETPSADDAAQQGDSLEVQINDAQTMKILKDIAGANDEFKELRGKMTSWKTAESLRDAMLNHLKALAAKDLTAQEKADELHKKNIEASPVRTSIQKEIKPAETVKKDSVQKTGKAGYTRIDAVCDALLKVKPKTIADWVTATNSVFGNDNDKESAAMIKYASKVLSHFDIDFPKA